MVDFYAVYDTVEDYGGWDHFSTNADDGYSIWTNESNPRYQLVFYNWDIDYGDDPCGLRIDDTEEEDARGFNREIALIILEGETEIEEVVREFLDESQDLL